MELRDRILQCDNGAHCSTFILVLGDRAEISCEAHVRSLLLADDVAMALGYGTSADRGRCGIGVGHGNPGPVALWLAASRCVVCGHGEWGLASSGVGALCSPPTVVAWLLAPHEMPVGAVTGVVKHHLLVR